MDDAAGMDGLDREGDVAQDSNSIVAAELARGHVDVLTVDALHDEDRHALEAEDLEDLGDPGVDDAGRSVDLDPELGQGLARGRQRQGLERDEATGNVLLLSLFNLLKYGCIFLRCRHIRHSIRPCDT